jgi:hypothetical protein
VDYKELAPSSEKNVAQQRATRPTVIGPMNDKMAHQHIMDSYGSHLTFSLFNFVYYLIPPSLNCNSFISLDILFILVLIHPHIVLDLYIHALLL